MPLTRKACRSRLRLRRQPGAYADNPEAVALALRVGAVLTEEPPAASVFLCLAAVAVRRAADAADAAEEAAKEARQ
jgi:hypothetical protein